MRELVTVTCPTQPSLSIPHLGVHFVDGKAEVDVATLAELVPYQVHGVVIDAQVGVPPLPDAPEDVQQGDAPQDGQQGDAPEDGQQGDAPQDGQQGDAPEDPVQKPDSSPTKPARRNPGKPFG